jgi:hydroxymethylbilane synthase
MTRQQTIVIGTRGSPLAIAQAEEVKSRLLAAHGDLSDSEIELRIFRTQGDRIQDKSLREFGGKGLFTKEIEDAMLAGEVDLGVHSSKDLPTDLPAGLVLSCLLEREDPRDAFISLNHASFEGLPEGAVVGSSSLRRAAQALNIRPDLKIVEFRGSVNTRLRKLEEGVADATFLACAGLNRLGMSGRITEAMAPEMMLPAVAQGAIGIESRIDDPRIDSRLEALNDDDTWTRVTAERAFLAALDGSCRTPIAALAELVDGELLFHGEILTPDGETCHTAMRRGSASDAFVMGDDAGRDLKAVAGPNFFTD